MEKEIFETDERKEDIKNRKQRERFYMKLWFTLPIVILIFLMSIYGIGYIRGRVSKESPLEVVNDITEKIYEEDIKGTEGELEIKVSDLKLEEVFELSQLSTTEYSYDAIYTHYDEKGKNIEYYAAYEGSVKIGIDFSKIIVEVNDEEKKVYIYTPKCKVQKVNVDITDFIFVNKKAETETVVADALNLCEDELKDRVKGDSDLMKMSKENTISAIKALTEPIIAQVDEEYEVEVKYGEVKKW